MKKRINLLIAIPIAIFFFFIFISNYFILGATEEKPFSYYFFLSAFTTILLFTVYPKIYNFFQSRTPKPYSLRNDEQVVLDHDVYMTIAIIPEKVNFRLTNKNVILSYNKRDAVYSLDKLKSTKIKSFFKKPISLQLGFHKRKIGFMTENVLDIEREVRQIINQ